MTTGHGAPALHDELPNFRQRRRCLHLRFVRVVLASVSEEQDGQEPRLKLMAPPAFGCTQQRVSAKERN